MTRDVETLQMILKYSLYVAAFFATLFPILYSFSRWNESGLGRILMIHGITLALALDVTVLFFFWTPNDILIVFWTELIAFSLIGVASILMCFYLVRFNYLKRRTNESA